MGLEEDEEQELSKPDFFKCGDELEEGKMVEGGVSGTILSCRIQEK